MNTPFPERCLRGLRDNEFIHRDENGKVLFITELAFRPPTKKSNLENRVNRRHKSNHYELSINWEDHATESFQLLPHTSTGSEIRLRAIHSTETCFFLENYLRH